MQHQWQLCFGADFLSLMPPNTLFHWKVIQSLKQTETVILPSQNNAQSWWEMTNGASCTNLHPSTSPRVPAFAVPVHPWFFWRGWWQWRGTQVVLRQSRSYPEIKPTDQHKDTNCSTVWKSNKLRKTGRPTKVERKDKSKRECEMWTQNDISPLSLRSSMTTSLSFFSPFSSSITIPLFSSMAFTRSSGWNNTVLLSNCEGPSNNKKIKKIKKNPSKDGHYHLERRAKTYPNKCMLTGRFRRGVLTPLTFACHRLIPWLLLLWYVPSSQWKAAKVNFTLVRTFFTMEGGKSEFYFGTYLLHNGRRQKWILLWYVPSSQWKAAKVNFTLVRTFFTMEGGKSEFYFGTYLLHNGRQQKWILLWYVPSSQWKAAKVNLQILHCQL